VGVWCAQYASCNNVQHRNNLWVVALNGTDHVSPPKYEQRGVKP
jgi:hypothetical protein